MIACANCGSRSGIVHQFLDTPASCRHATLDDCVGALRDDLNDALSMLRTLPSSPRMRLDVSDVVANAIDVKLRTFADEVAEVARENKCLRIRWSRIKAYAGKRSQPPAWSNPLADLLCDLEDDGVL